MLKLFNALLIGVFVLLWAEAIVHYATKFEGSLLRRLSYPILYWHIIYMVKLSLLRKGPLEKYTQVADFIVSNSVFIINFTYVSLLCEYAIYVSPTPTFEFTPV